MMTDAVHLCYALQAQLKIAAGEERKLNLIMGFGDKALIESTESKMGSAQAAEEALRMTKDFWRDLTGRLRISTGKKSFDTIVNGWLLYQTYVSRLLDARVITNLAVLTVFAISCRM